MSIVHRPYDDQIVAIQREIHRLYTTMIQDEELSVLEQLDYLKKICYIGMVVTTKEDSHEIHNDNRHHRVAEYIPEP